MGQARAGRSSVQSRNPTGLERDHGEWLLAELSRPQAYPRPVERVEVLRTLVSFLFFAGERVYKVKQPVALGFIDATTLARRRFLCQEELRLNAELAPGVHLGVVPITSGADGHLRVGGAGEPVEWAVEMVRLPRARMLASLLAHGVIDNAEMNALADRLAAFHAQAPRGPRVDVHGSPAAVARNARENLTALAAFVGPAGDARAVLAPRLHAFLAAGVERFLAERGELLARRVREGRIREGHGDLHAENVCLLEDRLVIYDRIEFSEGLRCLDVASDLAFLAMDLDRRGFPGFAAYLVHRYAERAGDPGLTRVLGFYKAYRTLVRAKVEALAAAGLPAGAGGRERRVLAAVEHVNLAVGYGLRPALVLLGGLPASGKTFLAPHLARPLCAAVLHSDERRKRLAGMARDTHAPAAWGQGLYAPEARRETYRSLLADAGRLLDSGRSVVVDASFLRREFRRPFLDAAVRRAAPVCFVQVEVSESVARERLELRGARGSSDADLEVHLAERKAAEPPDELDPALRLLLESAAEPPVRQASRVLAALVAQPGAAAAS